MSKILVLGAWHLGSVVGTCLADAGNDVWLWDQSPRIAGLWCNGKTPIKEPGLDVLVGTYFGQSLHWAGDRFAELSRKMDWVVLAYDTPINDRDEIILTDVLEGFERLLAAGFNDRTNFLFTTQLPVGTSSKLRERLKQVAPSWTGHVLYMPENLRLGEAVQSFKNPDRAVLGLDDLSPVARAELAAAFQHLTANTKTPLNIMSLESAEMVKHALNSFLATCVVYANELSVICEQAGADAWQVLGSLKQDSRVGPRAYLRPGLGFAGGTLARDVKTLSQMNGGRFFSQVYQINSDRNQWILDHLEETLANVKGGARIVLLGVTYKPGTSTVRRSPALEIGELLRRRGAVCIALDPQADLGELEASELAALPFVLTTDAAMAFDGADAAILITEWPDFIEYDWKTLSGLMRSSLLLDTKNHLSVGKSATHFNRVLVPGLSASIGINA